MKSRNPHDDNKRTTLQTPIKKPPSRNIDQRQTRTAHHTHTHTKNDVVSCQTYFYFDFVCEEHVLTTLIDQNCVFGPSPSRCILTAANRLSLSLFLSLSLICVCCLSLNRFAQVKTMIQAVSRRLIQRPLAGGASIYSSSSLRSLHGVSDHRAIDLI